MQKPNMLNEIIEAVYLAFGDDKDIVIDCYLYLMSLKSGEGVKRLADKTEQVLIEMGRCTECGEKLTTKQIKDYHVETGDYEIVNVKCCPNCGEIDD